MHTSVAPRIPRRAPTSRGARATPRHSLCPPEGLGVQARWRNAGPACDRAANAGQQARAEPESQHSAVPLHLQVNPTSSKPSRYQGKRPPGIAVR